MTKRSQWTDFDKETRKYIKKRDGERCVYCKQKGALQIAHIFLSRAFGGRGCKENGVLLCLKHHQILDNPIGKQMDEKIEIERTCKKYLEEVENVIPTKEFIETLKFDKVKYLKEVDSKYAENNVKLNKQVQPLKFTLKCKSCTSCVKNKFSNSTIPTYYCKFQKKIINKNEEACTYYRGRKNI